MQIFTNKITFLTYWFSLAIERSGASESLTDITMKVDEVMRLAKDRDHDIPRGMDCLDFGAAISALKLGRKVRRSGWNGKGMWLIMMPSMELPPYRSQSESKKVNDRTAKIIGEDTPFYCDPYIVMWTASGTWQPGWIASQADMLAEDWEVLPESHRPTSWKGALLNGDTGEVNEEQVNGDLQQ